MKLLFDHVTYRYKRAGSSQKDALRDVTLTLSSSEITGIIGPTGSGKSTLLKLCNGLYPPSEGHVFADDEDIQAKTFDLVRFRTQVGLVFQYPEHQLFEETVFKDVCFGPLNQGLPVKEAELRAFEALRMVRIGEEQFERPPYRLSGGEMRRVAIAGVIAMRPKLLVLDEPTAGLDPQSAASLIDLIRSMHRANGPGVVMVSHHMEEIASLANRIIVLDRGQVVLDDTPQRVFQNAEALLRIGLNIPQYTYVLQRLKEKGFDIDTGAVNMEAAVEAILAANRRN